MTQNVHQKFTERENQLRLYVIQFTIDRQRAFHLERDEEEAACALQMSHEEYETIIERLIERDGMVIDEEKNVNFIYPISALETSHRVVLEDGRQFFAMCAIDAIGSAFTLHQNTEIFSECAGCGKPVYVKIKNGEVESYEPKTLQALTFPLGEISNWAGSC